MAFFFPITFPFIPNHFTPSYPSHFPTFPLNTAPARILGPNIYCAGLSLIHMPQFVSALSLDGTTQCKKRTRTVNFNNQIKRLRQLNQCTRIPDEALKYYSSKTYATLDHSSFYRVSAVFLFMKASDRSIVKSLRVFQLLSRSPNPSLSSSPNRSSSARHPISSFISPDYFFPAADVCDFLYSDRSNTSNSTKFLSFDHKIHLYSVSSKHKQNSAYKSEDCKVKLILLRCSGVDQLIQRFSACRPWTSSLRQLLAATGQQKAFTCERALAAAPQKDLLVEYHSFAVEQQIDDS